MWCFHRWSLPIGNYQVCDKCGKFMTIQCHHKWSAIDSTNRQTCEKCGEVKTLPKAECCHHWNEKETVYFGGHKDTEGKMTGWNHRKIRFFCDICGTQKEETFS